MDPRRIILVTLLATVITAFFIFDLGSYLTLENLKSQQIELGPWRAENPWQSALVFFVVYVAVTALSLPGAAIMSLAIGAIFGLVAGVILVSFASTLGFVARCSAIPVWRQVESTQCRY